MGLENYDPADELRQDIESAIAAQENGGEHEPGEATDGPEPDTDEGADATRGPEPETERERDELGRFKAKAEEGEEEDGPSEKPTEAKVEPAAPEAAKTETRPPPGFSVASKAAWDALPESVRADIAKREQEVDNGFKRYAGLGKFAEEAERNGTSLQNAITDYSAIENALKQNFVGGVEFICQRLGVDPRRLADVMARRYGAAAPQPAAAPTQQVPAFDQEAMMRQFQQIAAAEAENRVQAMRAEAERAQIDRQIETFGADPKNKFFPNVRQDMAGLVQIGKANTLEEAYQAACWLNPETRAILQGEASGGRNKDAANAASKARNAAKAVGGSPSPGASPDAKRGRGDLSLEDEIRAAYEAQMGQI